MSTFTEWLSQQEARTDAVGSLARHVAEDTRQGCLRSHTVQGVTDHACVVHSPDLANLEALEQATAEYAAATA